jgi:hypothetical protein
LKKTITYVFLFLVSFAYSYETLEHFSILKDNDFCTEESSESEEPNEKSERTHSDDNFFNDKHLHYRLSSAPAELGWASAQYHNQNNAFTSSDYSHEVFSPPEAGIKF